MSTRKTNHRESNGRDTINSGSKDVSIFKIEVPIKSLARVHGGDQRSRTFSPKQFILPRSTTHQGHVHQTIFLVVRSSLEPSPSLRQSPDYYDSFLLF
ncbi:hypothetical protein ES332_D01G181300v1 [Gossypium tomentosum]|uniref:Uncharacterized protein n=1 Tax=Gossypium tomentosum TaxID=34277 RepID=A0A5D2MAK0_GOSTO|nr:hypothetical protein ES332_D01G181300v1 [Gossypium tomentosum]